MEEPFIWIDSTHVEAARHTKTCQVDDIVVEGLQVGQTIKLVCVWFGAYGTTQARIRQIIPLVGTPRGSVILGS